MRVLVRTAVTLCTHNVFLHALQMEYKRAGREWRMQGTEKKQNLKLENIFSANVVGKFLFPSI